MAKLDASNTLPVVLSLKYGLSPAGAEKYVEETGFEAPRSYLLHVSLPDLPPDLRKRAAVLRKQIEIAQPWVSFTAAQSHPLIDATTEDAEVLIAAWEKHVAEAFALAETMKKMDEQNARADELMKRGYADQISGWVSAYGSDRLKLSQSRKYQVAGLYLRERLAVEFPGFVADVNKKAKWSARANPSDEALAIETKIIESARRLDERYTVRIVWLERDVEGSDAKGEAIYVSPYLGQYNLFLEDLSRAK
jgi:hypothetical protein